MSDAIKNAAFTYIDQQHKEMLSLWETFVNIDSGINCKNGAMKMGNICAAILGEIGFSVKRIQYEKYGDLIIAELGDMTKPFVLLMGHMDTVFKEGEAQKRPFTIKEDGKVYGPGALDMKGGLVVMLSALQAVHAAGGALPPIKVILNPNEEIAHGDTKAEEIIESEAHGALYTLNFETSYTDHTVVVQRKGSWHFTVEVFGKGCHVGNDPENGRNAILEMAHKVIAIEALTDFSQGYNFNVGTITGGTVSNAGPEYCKIEVNARFLSEKDFNMLKEKVVKICDKTYIDGTRTVFSEGQAFAVMEKLPSTLELLDKVNQVAAENGFPTLIGKLSGGGSDAAYTVKAGVPTICAMGVEGARNHTPEEWADKDSLFWRAKLAAALLLKKESLL